MNQEKLKFRKNSKSHFDYFQEKYSAQEIINYVIISRKLENENCFNEIVKIYNLKTNRKKLNKVLEHKYFGSLFKSQKIKSF